MILTDGVLNRSDSSVLDDTCIEGALSYKYFDPSANNNQTSTETVIMVEDEHGNQQDGMCYMIGRYYLKHRLYSE